MILESPVFNLESALNASKYGVDRIELCSNFAEGGETPGSGMLIFLKKRISIPIYVMIRPRGGDFFYSDDEIDVMEEEIRVLSGFGADGFVFGILNNDRRLNQSACNRLIQSSGRKPCTLHRAIDVSNNLIETVESAILCGFKRVLTSGGKSSVGDGLNEIINLLKIAGDRITIMPGGGMKPEFVQPLRESGFLKEIHASCKMFQPVSQRMQTDSKISFESQNPEGILTIDPEQVNQFKKVINLKQY